MQDPLFQLVPEQPLDLHTLFNPAQQSSPSAGGQLGDGGSPKENIENLPMESVNEMAEIVDQFSGDSIESTEETMTNTLMDRIKKVEEEYNSRPIPVYGTLQKRLLTLAKSLADTEYQSHAKSLCKLLEE